MGRPNLGIRKVSSCFTLTIKQKDCLMEISKHTGISQSSLIGKWIEEAYAGSMHEKIANEME